MTDEQFEMQMEPLIEEVSEFLEKQTNKQNIMLNPRGVAKLNAVYSALCNIVKKIDPDFTIEIKEDTFIKGTMHITVMCEAFIIDDDNKKVIALILEHCPTVDIYYTTKKGGKTVLVFEIPKVYVTF